MENTKSFVRRIEHKLGRPLTESEKIAVTPLNELKIKAWCHISDKYEIKQDINTGKIYQLRKRGRNR